MQQAHALHAEQIGYDVVKLIQTRRPANATVDPSEMVGEQLLNASYDLLKLGRKDRGLVAIGPLRCATGQTARRVEMVRQRAADFSIELAFNFLQVSVDTRVTSQ
jgi:hypothetical protein